jgi:hypothetical protein
LPVDVLVVADSMRCYSRGGIHLWKVAVNKAGEEPVLLEVIKHPRKTSFHHLSWNADGRLVDWLG